MFTIHFAAACIRYAIVIRLKSMNEQVSYTLIKFPKDNPKWKYDYTLNKMKQEKYYQTFVEKQLYKIENCSQLHMLLV